MSNVPGRRRRRRPGQRRSRRLPSVAVLGIVLLSLSAGCVYYNTFYLARRYYREAEEMRLNA